MRARTGRPFVPSAGCDDDAAKEQTELEILERETRLELATPTLENS
jgi:hypothetical protein